MNSYCDPVFSGMRLVTCKRRIIGFCCTAEWFGFILFCEVEEEEDSFVLGREAMGSSSDTMKEFVGESEWNCNLCILEAFSVYN